MHEDLENLGGNVVPNKVASQDGGEMVMADDYWGWLPSLVAVACSRAEADHYDWIPLNSMGGKRRAKVLGHSIYFYDSWASLN